MNFIKSSLRVAAVLAATASLIPHIGEADDEAALRIFIHAGPKTHGPGQHDHPRFLEEWTVLLEERGAAVEGGMSFPTAEELAETDVLIIHRPNGGFISGENRANIEAYADRGGGIVVIHAAVVSDDPHWFKTLVGGAWENGHSRWFEGDVQVNFTDEAHPITESAVDFEFEDEIYWNLHFADEAEILAISSRQNVTEAPQMWVYDTDNRRSFVWLQGHIYASFSLPHFRALLLRGIAWAGNRDVDLLTLKEEVESLSKSE